MTALAFETTFDMRSDAGGRDPDTFSPTLHRYHMMLWSKPLPDGSPFRLESSTDGKYLVHRSGGEELRLASDAIIPTFIHYTATQPVISQVNDGVIRRYRYSKLTYTIGAFVLWPAHKIDGKLTINSARGFNRKISDRFDLTLECIRRHYLGEQSPLAESFSRYSDFFALFGDFAQYTEFWLLQDLVDPDGAVRFFIPFDDFRTPALPRTPDDYVRYRERTTDFIHARNSRMMDWVRSTGAGRVTRSSQWSTAATQMMRTRRKARSRRSATRD